MTLKELSNSLNIKVTERHLGAVERMDGGMSIALLIELANFFDVSTDYLLKISDTRKKRDSI